MRYRGCYLTIRKRPPDLLVLPDSTVDWSLFFFAQDHRICQLSIGRFQDLELFMAISYFFEAGPGVLGLSDRGLSISLATCQTVRSWVAPPRSGRHSFLLPILSQPFLIKLKAISFFVTSHLSSLPRDLVRHNGQTAGSRINFPREPQPQKSMYNLPEV